MDSRPGDETLLFAVAERDMGAFRTLYGRHAGWLAIRLARRCNDRDLVADAIQDTFVAVWQKPGGFRGDGDNAAWLWGIALAQALTAWRGSPRFFLGWQLALCAIAVLVAGPARGRGAGGRRGRPAATRP